MFDTLPICAKIAQIHTHPADIDMNEPSDEILTIDEVAAYLRLGDERFIALQPTAKFRPSSWAARGASDARSWIVGLQAGLTRTVAPSQMEWRREPSCLATSFQQPGARQA